MAEAIAAAAAIQLVNDEIVSGGAHLGNAISSAFGGETTSSTPKKSSKKGNMSDDEIETTKVDTDENWISLYGPSKYTRSFLGDSWDEFEIIESGQLYYVCNADGTHTLDCPEEIAAQIKKSEAFGGDRYAHEGLGVDFETNGPWVMPSVKRAEAYKRSEVFGGGRATCCKFHDNDFAQLGVGIALYFKTLRALSIVFFILTILALPAFFIYLSGKRMQSRLPDPLSIGKVSVSNIGPLTYDAALQLEDSFSCEGSELLSLSNISGFIASTTSSVTLLGKNNTNTTSSVSYTEADIQRLIRCKIYSSPELSQLTFFSFASIPSITLSGPNAGYVLSFFEFISAIVMLLFALFFRAATNSFVAFAERKNVSAADYTIYVRGLPIDATLGEVRDHFSRLFALDGSGVDVMGNWSTEKNKIMIEKNRILSVTGGVPPLPPPMPKGDPSNLAFAVPRDVKSLKKAASAAKKKIEKRRQGGIVSDMDPDVNFKDRVDTVALGIVTDTSHNHVNGYLGTWVADVSLVTKSNKLLTTYMAAEVMTESLRLARATVKMYSEGTPLPTGPNGKKREASMKQVDKIGSQLAVLQESVKRRYGKKLNDSDERDLSYLDQLCVGSAYVTFNCEESRIRCLQAYSGSTSWLIRAFQGPHLRFRCPAAPGFHAPEGTEVTLDKLGRLKWNTWYKDKFSRFGAGYTLIVEDAPDPSDVIHENLAITSRSRTIRQCITGIISILLVAIGLIIMVIAQGYSSAVAGKTPNLSLCNVDLPALFMGHYDNVTDAALAIVEGFGTSQLKERIGVLSSSAPTSYSYPGRRLLEKGLKDNDQSSLHDANLSPWALAFAIAAASGDDLVMSSATSSATANALNAKYSYGHSLYTTVAQAKRSLLQVNATTDDDFTDWSLIPGDDDPKIGRDDTLEYPQLTRLNTLAGRAKEDAMCASPNAVNVADGVQVRRLLAYRYNFSDVNVSSRKRFPNLPYQLDKDIKRQGNSVDFDFGTAIPYARNKGNFTVACSLTSAQAAVIDGASKGGFGPKGSAIALNDVACPDPRLVSAGVGLCPCAITTTSATCSTLSCFRPELETPKTLCKSFTASTVLGCYCQGALAMYVEELGAINGFLQFTDNEMDTCKVFVETYATAQSVIILSSGMASVVNVLLGIIIPILTGLEGHVSLSQRSKSLAVKVAAAQTINTGLTAVLVNARLAEDSTVKLPPIITQIGLLSGEYEDFTTPWYGTVGTTIITTAAINALIPPTLMTVEFFLDLCSRRSVLNTPGAVVRQSQLDELFVGARFATPPRYPLVITMTVVSYTYSGGLPLLLPLAAIGFLMQYAVDKWMLLKFYRKPAAYDSSMTMLLLEIIPWAVLLHLGFAVWQFSSGSIPSAYLSSEFIQYAATLAGASNIGGQASSFLESYKAIASQYDSIGLVPRVLRLNTFPLALFFLILLIFLIASTVLAVLGGAAMTLFSTLTCGFVCCRCCISSTGAVKVRRSRVKVSDAVGAALQQFFDHVKAYRHLPIIKSALLFQNLFLKRAAASIAQEGTEGPPEFQLGLATDGKTSGKGKSLAPFTEEFSRVHDTKSAARTLSSVEISAGWRLQEVDVRTQDDVNAKESAHDFAVIKAALEAKVAPKGAESFLEGVNPLAEPRPVRGALRSYVRKALALSTTPIGEDELQRETEGDDYATGGEEEGDEESGVASPTTAKVTVVVAANDSKSRKKTDPRFPTILYLRKVHLNEEESASSKKAAAKLKKKSSSKKDVTSPTLTTDTDTKVVNKAGLAKKSWEIINDIGISSYDVRKNPLYTAAFVVSQEASATTGNAINEPGSPGKGGKGDEENSMTSSSQTPASPSGVEIKKKKKKKIVPE
jgi:hypothetical protein